MSLSWMRRLPSCGRATASLLLGATLIGLPCAAATTSMASAGAAHVRPMTDLKIAATIKIGTTADWVAIAPKGVWVGSTGPNAVSEIDPATNRVTTVPLPGHPCAGITTDGTSVWVPLCGPVPRLAKVDVARRVLDRVFDVGPAAPEGGITVGAGSVWMVTDKQGSLARIEPASGRIVQMISVPEGSYNPVFSDGRVWVSRVADAEVTVVDAGTGTVTGHVAVGPHPRFITTGANSVWTLNQAEGSLSRIDTAGRRPVVTLPLHTPGPGGDITFADGRVWTTMMATPLSITNASDARLLCQWQGAGGDSLGVGHGAIWLTNLKAGTVSRINLNDLPTDCRVGASG